MIYTGVSPGKNMVASVLKRSASVELARRARGHALRMVHQANASHIGSALSVLDILAVLYCDVMAHRPGELTWERRDRLILSKGHAAVALYAVLAEQGYFPLSELQTYGEDGTRLMGHASHQVPGVELSTGSLGHGLSVSCGLALALKNSPSRIFCVMGDGELNEGSNWEALMFAAHHRLTNLTAIVDQNRIQSLGSTADVLDLGELSSKLESFGWRCVAVNGHDHEELRAELGRDSMDRPTAVIAQTVKGFGVDYMENELLWHYRSPNLDELQRALAQVAG